LFLSRDFYTTSSICLPPPMIFFRPLPINNSHALASLTPLSATFHGSVRYQICQPSYTSKRHRIHWPSTTHFRCLCFQPSTSLPHQLLTMYSVSQPALIFFYFFFVRCKDVFVVCVVQEKSSFI
jgi:hypothetical protein